MKRTAIAILAYVALIALAVIGIHATAEAAPAHSAPVSQPATHDDDMVTADDMRAAYADYGIDASEFQVIVSDLPMLNCGSAHSFNFTGGGCTFRGGHSDAVIVLSPSADLHVILHEYAHAKFGSSECAAERYANTVERYEEWHYASCKYGVEPN